MGEAGLVCGVCDTENRPGARFCDSCGSALTPVCPSCGTENRQGARFCDACGTSLAGAAPAPTSAPTKAPTGEAPRSRPRASTPESASVEPASDERRIVTILFCDVKGSTEAAEQLDPEEWQEVIDGALQRMIEPVYRYGGMVARLMGDAILAFFGAPIAHEDDPERAVLAGLDILDNVGKYTATVVENGGPEVAVRVGINTGLVLVGEVGSDQKAEYTAMGDPINVAARMEQQAEPGTVLVAEPTWRAVRDRFEWVELGELDVRGRSEPVRGFRPVGRRGAGSAVADEDDLLVGRDDEIAVLDDAVDRLAAGLGSVVLLSGEAGIGKSRLARECCRRARRRGATVVETSAASYEAEVAYGFGRRLAEATLRARGGDDRSLPELLDDIADPPTRRGLAQLLGDELSEKPDDDLAGSVARSVAALLTVDDTPAVVICEDLQWADRASTDVLEQLCRQVRRRPLLVVGMLRVAREAPAWSLRRTLEDTLPGAVHLIEVGDLPPAAVRTLIEHYHPDDDRRLDDWVDRAGGNPFFAQQLALVAPADSGDDPLPESVQTLLVSRLDRQSADARRAAQIGAVLGDEVGDAMLDELGVSLDAVDELVDAGVFVETARSPERRVRFAHELMAGAARSTISNRDRARYHARVAEVLEARAGGRENEQADVIARHYRSAGDDRAVRWEIIAGARAARLGAAAEAIDLLERARDTVEVDRAQLGLDPDLERSLYLSLGRAYELQSDWDNAEATYRSLLAEAEQVGDQEAEVAAIAALALRFAGFATNDSGEELHDLLERGHRLAAELGDAGYQARFHWIESLSGYRLGGDGGIDHHERALELARQAGDDELLAYILNDEMVPLTDDGRIDEAVVQLAEARRLFEQLGMRNMSADVANSSGGVEKALGNFRDARKSFEQVFQIGMDLDNEWLQHVGRTMIGRVSTDLADWGGWWMHLEPYAGLEIIAPPHGFAVSPLADGYLRLGLAEEALRVAEATAPHMVEVFTPVAAELTYVHGIALALLGRTDEAREYFREGEAYGLEWSAVVWSTTARRRAELSLQFALPEGDIDGAMAAVDDFEEGMRSLGFEGEVLRALELKSRVKLARGDVTPDDWWPLVEEGRARGFGWLEIRAMAGLAATTGEAEHKRQALRLVEASAEGLPEAFRESYLGLDWVRVLT